MNFFITEKRVKSFDLDLILKASLPIGTVHEWNGQRYKKIAEGDWRPISTGKKNTNEKQSQKRPTKKINFEEKIKKIEQALSAKLESTASEEHKKREEHLKEGGTPADYGRPSNGLGPPPPENEGFVKPGKETSVKDVELFIEKFKPDYVELQGLGFALKAAGASHFGNRLKDKLSLHEKMHGRLKERSLNTATDVIGARSLSDSIENQKSVLEHMKKSFQIVEIEDSSSKPRPDGYRAIHVLFKTSSGKISELQIKTHRQQVFSGFTHDTIYKPSKELAKEFGKGEDGKPRNQEVSQYLTELSAYLYGLDTGEQDSPEKRPKEPKILTDNGIKFPWKDIERLNKKDFSKISKEERAQKKNFESFETKEKGKIKHFVVVRSPKKVNLEIKEFDSFEDADKFVKQMSSKHKGQMPMGYSESKKEFLKVFSEYQPEGWDSDTKKSIIFEVEAHYPTYFEYLQKADRPNHLYIRKYQKGSRTVYVYNRDGKEAHRYGDNDSMEQLLDMGEHLNSKDDARELNEIGFNKLDKQRWKVVFDRIKLQPPEIQTQSLNLVRNILKKYKRQLTQHFGEEEYEHTGLSDPTIHMVVPERHRTYKTIQLPLKSDGRLNRNNFEKYVQLHRDMRLKGGNDENGNFVWVIPRDVEKTFDWEKYQQRLGELGVSLSHIPDPLPESEGRDSSKVVRVRVSSDNKISFYHPYDSKLVNFFSNRGGEISGIMEYNPTEKSRETYEIELAQEAVQKIKERFPDWEVVTEGFDEAVRREEERQAELRKPIPHVSEKLDPQFKLFPYQNEAVRFLEAADGNALIGDEMGLGKTLQSLAFVASKNKRVLVVCPKVVRRTWIKEAEKFFPGHFQNKSKELIAADLKHGAPDLRNVNIATVNYESLEKFRPAIEAAGFDAIIVDESHRIKNPKAKATKLISEMAPMFAHKMLLSGTAIKNKKEELHTQIEIIRPGLFSRFGLKFGTIGGVWNKLKKNGVYLARQKKKVLTDLPEKTTQIAEVPVSGMPRLPTDIGEMSAARVVAAIAKTSATKDFVQEVIDSSDSNVLVFTESLDAAKKLKEELGDVAILHHGQMSDDAREKAKEEFQNETSTKRVFVSTRQSLAVGATLTRADKVVFNDLPWTAADVRQAEDRAHRVGQRNNVNVYWITAQNSDWDVNLSEIVKKKYELNRKMNEGKQLTKEEREWMEKPVSLDDIRASFHKSDAVFVIDSILNKNEIFFIPSDLFKARTHKYLRKYRRGSRWIYIYHEPSQKPKTIDENAFNKIKKLAEMGNARARQIIDEMEEVPHEKIDLLQRLATGFADTESGKRAKETLENMGIPILQEEDLQPEIPPPPPQDQSEKPFESPEKKAQFIKHIKQSLNEKIFGYLDNPTYRHTEQFKRLNSAGVTLDSVMSQLESANSIKGVLEKLHEQMKVVDNIHSGLTHQNSLARDARGYGNLGFTSAVKALEEANQLPTGYSTALLQARTGDNFEVPKIQEHLERIEREEKERKKQERIALAELHGSMAHFISKISRTRLNAEQVRELDASIRSIFGRSLRKEDWPYDFSAQGITVKIIGLQFSEGSLWFDLEAKTENGEVITNEWRRSWNRRGGRPHIHNDYLKVNTTHRNGARLGNLINVGQRKLMKAQPNGGTVTVTAALNVGGYTWANQGFSFEHDSDATGYRNSFKNFLSTYGISLTPSELALFKEPCHFSAFSNGKKYIFTSEERMPLSHQQITTKSLNGVEGEYPLTEQEISEGKSYRMLVHLGKKFMLGKGWRGIWDSNRDSIASRFAEKFVELKEAAAKVFGPEYSNVMGQAASGSRRVEPPPAPTPQLPPDQQAAVAHAQRAISWWRRGERRIVMSKRRVRSVLGMTQPNFEYFLANAPITRAMKNSLLNARRELQQPTTQAQPQPQPF